MRDKYGSGIWPFDEQIGGIAPVECFLPMALYKSSESGAFIVRGGTASK
jgi:hypothetical protein